MTSIYSVSIRVTVDVPIMIISKPVQDRKFSNPLISIWSSLGLNGIDEIVLMELNGVLLVAVNRGNTPTWQTTRREFLNDILFVILKCNILAC